MKPVQIVLTLSLLATFSSCNNSNSSNTKPASPEQIRQLEIDRLKNAPSATDFTAMIKPDRFDVQQANLSYDDQKEMYQDGCKVPNQMGGSDYKLDRSLKPGAEFTREFAISEPLRDNYWNKTNSVFIAVSDRITIKETNFEFMKMSNSMPFSSVDEIFISRPHMTETTEYEFKADGGFPSTKGKVDYNLSPAAENWLASNSSTSAFAWSCTVRTAESSTSTVDKGVYLVMGRLVPSYRTTSIYKGKVFCRNYRTAQDSDDLNDDEKQYIEMGEGTTIYVKIVSNKVGSDSWTDCGGNELFHSTSVKLNDGKQLSSWVEKYSKLPLK